MKKSVLVSFIILIFAIGGILFSQSLNNKSNISDNSQIKGEYTSDNIQSLNLEVVLTDNSIYYYDTTFTMNQKLVDIISNLSKENTDFSYETNKSEFGEYLTTINGIKADSTNEFWNIKVNGEDSVVGISDLSPQNNDVIRFSLIKF